MTTIKVQHHTNDSRKRDYDVAMTTLLRQEWTTLLRQEWKGGNEGVTWSAIMTQEWNMVDNCMMTTRGGQVLSLDGLLGACHEMAPSERDRHMLVSRMCVNRDAARSITIDNN